MSWLRNVSRLPLRWIGKSRHSAAGDGRGAQRLHVEQLEARNLLAVDIRIGAVYYEDAGGEDTAPDTIQITFAGGEPGTQLTQLRIETDKELNGLGNGDAFFDTAAGGLGAFASAPLQITEQTGFQVTSFSLEDGGGVLVFNFSGFDAGERLVFTVDVDERGFIGENAVAEGNEFQGSRLIAAFKAPHFFDVSGQDIFYDEYDPKLTASGLPLPADSYAPPNQTPSPVRTAGAFFNLQQTPLPITLSGTVFEDFNADNTQATGDPGIAGVQLELRQKVGADYVSINKFATTNAQGAYKFEGIAPGTYRVVETQPSEFQSVGARAGTIDGVTAGVVVTSDVLGEITLLGGQDSIDNDFAEFVPATLSGHVYHDRDNDGFREPGEEGIAGVTVLVERIENGQVVGSALQVATDGSGFWSVANLRPGAYRVTELQPAVYLDGLDRAGNAGGAAVNPGDLIAGVVLVGRQVGENYDFGELLPGSLRGRVHVDLDGDCVLDPGEQPLAGVTIELLSATGVVLRTTTTDAEGKYAFEGLAPNVSYGIREIQPSAYFDSGDSIGTAGGVLAANDLIDQIVLASGQNGVDYNFCELAPASLSGRVHASLDDDCDYELGEPLLAGVTIQLLNEQGAVLRTTTTESQGEYRFEGLQPGLKYGLRELQPAGYLDSEEMVGTAGGVIAGNDLMTGIVLASGQQGLHYDFCEKLPGSISGRIHADLDGDCVLDANESPLAGVSVQLLDAQGNVVRTTQTDAQGRYTFDQLAPGVDYGVRELQPGGYLDGEEHAGTAGGTLSANDQITGIRLLSGQNAVEYDFCEIVPASIRGRVHADLDGDCMFDPGEAPIAGVTIQLLGANGQVLRTTQTDGDGQYVFDQLTPGENYGVRELQPGGYFDGGENAGTAGGVVSNDLITQIVLAAGQSATGYDFCEMLPASLGGRVHADLNGDCEVQPGEPPLAGVTIELLDAAGNVVRTTQTDANGQYLFSNLEPGKTYGVRELQPGGYFDGDDHLGTAGGALAANDLMTQITLGSGQNAREYNFCEVPPAAISGYVFQDGPVLVIGDEPEDLAEALANLPSLRPGVRSGDDAPLVGVQLTLADAAGNIVGTTTTDARGFYSFGGLRPGVYSVVQSHPSGLYDGIDRAGTTGGVAQNPGDQISQITAIAGQTSWENNFSEVQILQSSIPQIIFPPPPQIPPPFAPNPIGPAPDPLRLYQPPPARPEPKLDYYGGAAVVGYTWHLSVINAGKPRGPQVAQVALRTASGQVDTFAWQQGSLDQSTWELLQSAAEEADMRSSSELAAKDLVFGMKGGTPVSGDFNGDGIADIGVYWRGHWFIDLNANGRWDEEDLWAKLGHDGDLPVTGDWDGDEKTDIGIFGRAWPGDTRAVLAEAGLPDPDNIPPGERRDLPPEEREAAIGLRTMRLTSTGPTRADLIDHVFHYGTAGDRPVTGDWNGDGTATVGVFRNGQWVLDVDGDGRWSEEDRRAHFGRTGDMPVVGDFNGDGQDEIGVYRGGAWHIDTNANFTMDREDLVLQHGSAADVPVVGDWSGSGHDQAGVYRDGVADSSTVVSQAPSGPRR